VTVAAEATALDAVLVHHYGVRVDGSGAQRTVISLSKPDGWASGKNAIELAINGKHQRTVTFEVQ
jgi:hypothetical protein